MNSQNLSLDLVRFLKGLGFSSQKISRMNNETRFYQDLNFDGDTAEEMIQYLENEFKVDVSNFEFDRYFPREFPGNNDFVSIVGSIIPFWRYFYNKKKQFEPLTLSMIDRAIKSKHWQL
jgi:hypothetical protein